MVERAIPAGVRERLGIGGGVTLVQTPASPYCISVRRVLEASGAAFALHDVGLADRSAVAELTDGAYYAVPVLVDSPHATMSRGDPEVDATRSPASPAVVVYESRDDGTEVARYVDAALGLGLFPAAMEGLQDLVVRYVEGEVEDAAFRIDDAFLIPSVEDVVERTLLLRHKERRFGKGCVDEWRASIPALTARVVDLLAPLDRMLAQHRFLLGERPTFADYALYGVLGRLTYTGHATIPPETANVVRWHGALGEVKLGAAGGGADRPDPVR